MLIWVKNLTKSGYMYIYISDSLYCAPEINVTFEINYTSIKLKKINILT